MISIFNVEKKNHTDQTETKQQRYVTLNNVLLPFI